MSDIWDEPLPFDELDPCCQREILDRKNKSEVDVKLRRVDKSNARQDQNKQVLKAASAIKDQAFSYCRCCEANADFPSLHSVRLDYANSLSKQAAVAEDEKDDDDDSLFDADNIPMTAEELERLNIVKRNQEIDQQLGIGLHREDLPFHIEQLIQPAIELPLVLHVFLDCKVSAVVDLACEQVAGMFRGSRFRRVDARSLLQYTSTGVIQPAFDHLQQQMMTRGYEAGWLALFRRGDLLTAVDTANEIYAETVPATVSRLRQVLEQAALDDREPPMSAVMAQQRVNHAKKQHEDEVDTEEAVNSYCGMAGCDRTYPHEHITDRGKPSFIMSTAAIGDEDEDYEDIFAKNERMRF